MKSNKYCLGCGVLLQDENMLQDGYTTNMDNDICQRCFRMKNYGEYEISTKSNDEYLKILKAVGKTKDLVLYLTDLLNLDRDLAHIKTYLNNPMILVLNKRDVLPKSVRDDKIIEYIKDLGINFIDIVIISANKNYNIDLLLKKIKLNQPSKKCYVVGHTNAGKSTLINKLIKNYSNQEATLTISPLPSTTLNKIEIVLSDYLTLVDTPGLVDHGNISNYVSTELLKKIHPKKEIKPKTYQLKKGQSLLIGDFMRIDYIEGARNSFTFYLSNDIKIKRVNLDKNMTLKNIAKRTYDIKYHEDLVVNGLGWVKIVDKATIDVFLDKDIEVFTRKSLI